MLVPTQVECSG